MSIFPLEYLRHIMDEIEYLIGRSANLSKEDFLEVVSPYMCKFKNS